VVPALSIVVPAHNEEAFLGATLSALDLAARSLGIPYEIVVVNDASTDRSAEIAASFGARVVPTNVRHIAAARNAGARAARAEMLVFVDADTIVSSRILRAAVDALRNGAVGGGASAHFEAEAPAASSSRAGHPSSVSAASTSVTTRARRFTSVGP
jgi:glycosyltransferase involved in cell wall biosynthesis